jgi:hypothetical protein
MPKWALLFLLPFPSQPERKISIRSFPVNAA